jgi:hypothetical protein
MFRALLCVLFLVAGQVTALAEDANKVADAAVENIDRLLQDSWDRDGITPTAISGDAEFCRRVWLDLAGVAPPVAQLREFLSDPSENKRERLVDRLLVSPQYANHMASRWNEVLLPPDAQTQLQQQQNVAALHEWLRSQFRDNVPYDYLVGGFLTAGGAGDTGPAIFYTSHSLEPEKLAAATSRIFMGIQLQCAQCHDHPFDRWTQEDFWRYAAFFSQLEQNDSQMGRNSIIEDRPGGEVTLPETDTVMPPRYPGVAEPPEKDPGDIRRRQLTIWMASRDNPYFARAAVNRAWAHLFGRGLVDPVDAMDKDNRPSHPELLDYLADYFIAHRFNLRTLYATLARTKAYGRTSSAAAADRPPEDAFAAMTVKTLSAEQFFDSLQQNVYRRSAPSLADRMSSERASRQQFLTRMSASGSSPRDYPHGVVQVLGMMNGPEINIATSPNQVGLLASLEAPFFSESDRIETLFLAALSRMPKDAEAKQFATHLAAAETSQEKIVAMSDLLWILLNTAECAVCP